MPKGKSANLGRLMAVKRSTKQHRQIKHFCQFPECNLYAEHIAVQGEFSGRVPVYLCLKHLLAFRELPLNGQDSIDFTKDRTIVIESTYSSYGTNKYDV